MPTAVVAEKPSVARDLARVLGAGRRGQGYLHGNGWVVTWAIGHLVELAEPAGIRAEWKRWQRRHLPMIPERWPLVVSEGTRDQFAVVKKILTSPKVDRVVCATDAGREGELIFRYVYEAAGSDKPVERLWISSLTDAAIRRGFAELAPGERFDALADAARGRSRADWLVGMNLSRACTLAWGETLSVGRVQTPTLALVVERELAIRAFVPEPYYEVVATFEAAAGDGAEAGRYRGTWFRGEQPTTDARRLPGDGAEARAVAARVAGAPGAVQSVRAERKRLPPPLLYDLTELQRHANRLYRFSAKKTLDLAQRLYQQWKLLTYPRTDSRHLSTDVAATLGEVVAAIAGPYREHLAPGTGERPLSRRFVDDARVGDHHAILPTATAADALALSRDERRIYDLVCRRLLAAWHRDHVWAVTTVITSVPAAGPAGPSPRPSPPGRGRPHPGRGPAAGTEVDRFVSTGKAIEEVGWKVLDPVAGGSSPAAAGDGKAGTPPPGDGKGGSGSRGKAESADDADQELPPGLEGGRAVTVLDAETLAKTTRPPRRYTEATLLSAMETAGRVLDDKELSAAMRERGLGTPATRAETIETLLGRDYMVREGKALAATDKGIRLIERVHPHVKSAAMTGEWEAKLGRIQRGEEDLASFLAGIEAYVREVVGEVLDGGGPNGDAPPDPTPPAGREGKDGGGGGRGAAEPAGSGGDPSPGGWPEAPPPEPPPDLDAEGSWELFAPPPEPPSPDPAPPRGVRSPTPPERLGELLSEVFVHTAFRPYQEAVCRAVTAGRDALVVMPTGAGKSLCYQLPGLARAGVTVVVSPLIALMEDQVGKLQALGLAAERIHSGRSRVAARAASRAYLEGRLDYLFIAPERLAVPGFPELLARGKPVLVAIDEAHCISHWGHDFRPEYRMLGERLPALRPAPVIALTATATPQVQDDIAAQLALAGPLRAIHGFRRENLAVEVVEMPPSARRRAVARLLAEEARRPALVYTPTRKEADRLGEELGESFPAAAYHAGMPGAVRDRVQAAFLGGELEVIVATIAFGMGIDKPDVRTVVHTGLPASLEGYYQEIGRAGRDGAPARAVLLYSWADRHTQEFLFTKSYPEPAVLGELYRALGERREPREAVAARVGLDDEELFARALEQLWIHGGALVDPEENLARGTPEWEGSYVVQREHRRGQLDDILRFAGGRACRMLELVGHFGDEEDSGRPCGLCDACAPQSCLVRRFRAPTADEEALLAEVVATLQVRDGQSTGQLHRASGGGDRRAFERLLGGLARAGLVTITDDRFEKDGRTIHFQRARLTYEGRRAAPADLAGVQVAEEPAAPERRRAKGRGAGRAPGSGGRSRGRSPTRSRSDIELAEAASPAVVEALKRWRLGEARRRRIPAFRIMTDRTLTALAAARPADEEELLAVRGIGPTLARKYGETLLGLLREGRI